MKNLASYSNFVNESKLQDDYREFFTNVLKVYGVKSPAAFKGDQELGRKFYADIKKGWTNGHGISEYGKELLAKFEKEGKVEESVNEELSKLSAEEMDNMVKDERKAEREQQEEEEYNREVRREEKILSNSEEEEEEGVMPSELWNESISKLLDIINSYDVRSTVIAKDTIKVICDDSTNVVNEIVEEFNKTYPEYIAELQEDDCTIIIDEK